MMATTTTISDESWGRVSRRTASGKTLHYVLRVLQQPERARACGSGPKSSADRRPVDPPPIVQLHIYEGENPHTAKDVTFDYNAFFFLYVSLENARPIAHGRVQTPAATSPPVLTGMPVSGCAYLDRPDPAGYFLFPDLSVRHEGPYRLSFELYEQRKERGDFDLPDPTANPEVLEEDECFNHVLGIKSQKFHVFSAKKFPGLAESTALSRTIAEQGCRVRIRRDVRMRRREGKTSNNDEFEQAQQDELARQRRTQSPADVYRARSASNSSMDRAPYGRRMSGVEYGPSPIAAAQLSRGMLSFGQGGYGSCQPPIAPLSTPVSPAHPPYPQGHHGGSYHAPSSASTYGLPGHSYGRPPSAHEDRRPSLAFSTTSSYGPMSRHQRPSQSSTSSLPSIDTSIMFRKPLMMDQSPVISPRSDLPSYSAHGLPPTPPARSGKRSLDESAGNESQPMVYRRASGKNVEKQYMGYPDEQPIEYYSRASTDDTYLKEEESYARKRPHLGTA